MRRSLRTMFCLGWLALVAGWVAPPAAQESAVAGEARREAGSAGGLDGEAAIGVAGAGAGAGNGDLLRAAMMRFFSNGLSRELGLSDEQLAAVMPHVREMERTRSAFRAEKLRLLREVQQAYRGGGTDEQLRGLLEAYSDLEQRADAEKRRLQAAVDAELSVRQQVEFRFFSQRFRRRLEQRIREMRSDGEGNTDRPRWRDRMRNRRLR